MMCHVNHLRHVLEIHIRIPPDERDFLHSLQINLRQPLFQILPANIFLIDLYRRRGILRRPDDLDHNRALNLSLGRRIFRWLRNLHFLSIFWIHRYH